MAAKNFFLLIYQHLCFDSPLDMKEGSCAASPFTIFLLFSVAWGILSRCLCLQSLALEANPLLTAPWLLIKGSIDWLLSREKAAVLDPEIWPRETYYFSEDPWQPFISCLSAPHARYISSLPSEKKKGKRKGISLGSGPTSRLWDKTKASDSQSLPADIALLRIDKLETHLRQVSFLPESLQWQFRW